MTKKAASEPKSKGAAGELVAKKEFMIVQNEYRREIKVGDDLKDVPEKYHANLATEGVI